MALLKKQGVCIKLSHNAYGKLAGLRFLLLSDYFLFLCDSRRVIHLGIFCQQFQGGLDSDVDIGFEWVTSPVPV